MSITTSTVRYTRHGDEYAAHVDGAYLGIVRREGAVWSASPRDERTGRYLPAGPFSTRARAGDALAYSTRHAHLVAARQAAPAETETPETPAEDTAAPAVDQVRAQLRAAQQLGRLPESATFHVATESDGTVNVDVRGMPDAWTYAQTGYGHGQYTGAALQTIETVCRILDGIGAVDAHSVVIESEEEAADRDADKQATPDELAPGMYRVRITVTNRDGVHTATEDMNPAAIDLARTRPGWSVEILGEARVTIVEDEQDAPAKPEQLATAHTPRKIGPKQWAIECTWGCGNAITTARKPPPMLGCSRPDCHAAHNASVTARQAEKAARPRTPRVRREIPASDWNMLVAFNRGRTTRPTADPRAVTGTPDNIDARASARARGELAAQASLTFDESDRQAMTVAQLRATAGDALALF